MTSSGQEHAGHRRVGQAPARRHPEVELTRGERDREIVRLHEEELTLDEIGKRFELSRERVRQILNERGVKPIGVEGQGRQRQRRLRHALDQRDSILSRWRQGQAIGALARELGVAPKAAQRVVDLHATEADSAARRQSLNASSAASDRRYTDHELVAAVRAVAERLGRVPSAQDYVRLARELALPSAPLIYNRMGWAAAVRAAGLAPRPSRRSYTRQWDSSACWTALEGLVDECGHVPSVQEYDRLARGRDDLPSLSTVRNRVGGWAVVRIRLATRLAGA